MTFLPLVGFTSSYQNVGSTAAVEATRRIGNLATTSVPSVSNAVLCKSSAHLLDHSGTAVSFFTSIRIPAALVAGSSLAIMFTNPTDLDRQTRSAWQNRILVLYHLFALLGFLLSINVVSTATDTATYLLLGMKNPFAYSAYELLRREVNFAFTSCRWSFDMSLCSFLLAVSGRLLVEFKLVSRQRRRSLAMLTMAMMSLLLDLFATTNATLHSWPHMGAMTVDLMRLSWREARHKPLRAASLLSAVLSVFFGWWACIRTKGFANFGYDEPNLPDTEQDDDESTINTNGEILSATDDSTE